MTIHGVRRLRRRLKVARLRLDLTTLNLAPASAGTRSITRGAEPEQLALAGAWARPERRLVVRRQAVLPTVVQRFVGDLTEEHPAGDPA